MVDSVPEQTVAKTFTEYVRAIRSDPVEDRMRFGIKNMVFA